MGISMIVKDEDIVQEEQIDVWWKIIVNKRWLLLIGGLLWSAVGIMLDRVAFKWLAHDDNVLLYLLLGTLAALIIWRFGFSHIAKKNIIRIDQMKQRASLFAFQKPSSYVIVVIMITMGKTMRRLPIPKHDLAILYMGIGGGLFLASLYYYRALLVD
jgi:hypothetical protein